MSKKKNGSKGQKRKGAPAYTPSKPNSPAQPPNPPSQATPPKQSAAVSTEEKVQFSTTQGGWNGYGLDQKAQELVLDARMRDKDSLNQAHKMRQTVAYGLERFWGEPFRLQSKPADQQKALFWIETWDALVEIMADAGIDLPNDKPNANDSIAIKLMAQKLWGLIRFDPKNPSKQIDPKDTSKPKLDNSDRQVALAVLTQLCDCIVWWTQRYK